MQLALDLPLPLREPTYVGLVPEQCGAYAIGLEKITEMWSDLIVLGSQEWREVGDEALLGSFRPDFEACWAHELAADIGVVTVRRDGELVGYFVGTVGQSIKQKGIRVFSETGIYLRAEVRSLKLVRHLLRYVEQVAKLFGCQALVVSHRPADMRIGTLYQRAGFVPLNVDYMKTIE